MALAVAKGPTRVLIYRGRTGQNVLTRELCVCVCSAGKLPQQSTSDSVFTGKVTVFL